MKERPSNSTIDDVARLAGVSASTVSRVINRNVPVSDDAVTRVEAAMRTLNYAPSAAARNLARRKTDTLGLLTANIFGDFFVPLLTGIEEVTSEAGFDLLISTSGRHGPHDRLPDALGLHNTDGLLVFAGALSDSAIELAHASRLPMVLIHQSGPAHLPVPCITIENKAASCAIVEHLITVHGRRRIAFLQGPPAQEDSYWRELGYREALERHGIAFDPSLVARGEFDRSVARASVSRLLESGVEFDGIFTGDDEAAVGVLQALSDGGKRVPEEISVVGFDDQRLASVLKPPLTTVHAPTDAVGRAAASQLIRLVRSGKAESLTLLPTEIVIRRSCGCDGN